MKNWFSRLLTLRPPKTVSVTLCDGRSLENLARSEAELIQKVDILEEQLSQVCHEAELAKQRADHARTAHAALNRRVNDLRVDWPAVHDRYFTKQGIAAREAGIPMNPKRKRK